MELVFLFLDSGSSFLDFSQENFHFCLIFGHPDLLLVHFVHHFLFEVHHANQDGTVSFLDIQASLLNQLSVFDGLAAALLLDVLAFLGGSLNSVLAFVKGLFNQDDQFLDFCFFLHFKDVHYQFTELLVHSIGTELLCAVLSGSIL